jgi:RimJ/RimL family protein N-acetyltransferase
MRSMPLPIPILPRPSPARVTLVGRYARLEPLDPARHGDDLYEATFAPGAAARLRYIPEVPAGRAAYHAWLASTAAGTDPLAFAVIDAASGRCGGRQALMRIVPEHGVVELGHIMWGPSIARSRVATEAFYLMARYAIDDLGYRRLEWKCDAENGPSRRAAARFGFAYEGTFRQHMVTKGRNRDTAWHAIVDADWPERRAALEAWLAPANFDPEGQQRSPLGGARGQPSVAARADA